MQWKFAIPHAWDPPESRTFWADVLLLPDDAQYEGSAMWITVDAILNADNYADDEWRQWHREQLARLGDDDLYMNTEKMDLVVRASDFDRSECLEWIAKWLQRSGLAWSGFVESDIASFGGRSAMADIVNRLKNEAGD